MKGQVAASAIALVLTLSAGSADAVLPPAQADAVRAALLTWLECVDCTETAVPSQELNELLHFGAAAIVPSLILTLQTGLSPARRTHFELLLRAQQAELAGRLPPHPPPLPALTDEYVKFYVANADAMYRLQAIQALRHLKTEPAVVPALRLAASDPAQRADVRAAAYAAVTAP